MTIRPANPSDLLEIQAIDAVGRAAPRPLALFTEALPRLRVFSDTWVLGFAEVQILFDEAELIDIAVAPEARRRGLGRRLLLDVLEAAAGAGARRVLLEVRRDNAPARKLYESVGFRQEGVRRAYYADGEDAVLYTCSVSSP